MNNKSETIFKILVQEFGLEPDSWDLEALMSGAENLDPKLRDGVKFVVEHWYELKLVGGVC